jgi:hypothetical protein
MRRMTDQSDHELVDAVVAGDKAPFAELVCRYEPVARAAAVSILPRYAPGSRRPAGDIPACLYQPGQTGGPLAVWTVGPEDRPAAGATDIK